MIFNQKILDIVNSYFGAWSKFYYLTLNLTKPMLKSAVPVMSQNWHRDPEDKKTRKVFIYLNDVQENTGPFIYVLGSQDGGKYGKFFPQKKPPKGAYPPIGAVEARVHANDIKTYTGEAGTVIFVDTAGLHRGGYATEKERIMFTAGFLSNASARRSRFRRGAMEGLTGNPAAHFALNRSMSKNAVRALSWHKYLRKSLPHGNMEKDE